MKPKLTGRVDGWPSGEADVIVFKPRSSSLQFSPLLLSDPGGLETRNHKEAASFRNEAATTRAWLRQLCNLYQFWADNLPADHIHTKVSRHVEAEAKRTIRRPIQRQSCIHAATPSRMRVHHGQGGQNQEQIFEPVGQCSQRSGHEIIDQRIAHFLFFAFLTLMPLLLGFGS